MYYLLTNGIPSPLVSIATTHVTMFVTMALTKSNLVLLERKQRRIQAKAKQRMVEQYPNKRLNIGGTQYVH